MKELELQIENLTKKGVGVTNAITSTTLAAVNVMQTDTSKSQDDDDAKSIWKKNIDDFYDDIKKGLDNAVEKMQAKTTEVAERIPKGPARDGVVKASLGACKTAQTILQGALQRVAGAPQAALAASAASLNLIRSWGEVLLEAVRMVTKSVLPKVLAGSLPNLASKQGLTGGKAKLTV